jgi:hypothetical protein
MRNLNCFCGLPSLIASLALVVLGGACSAGPGLTAAREVAWTAVYGSSAAGVAATREQDRVLVTLATVPARGVFIRLELPAGRQLHGQSWRNAAGVLHLAAPVPGGVELGAAPLAGYDGAAVTAMLTLAPATHSASMPPTGTANVIHDLSVADAGAGQVTLAWTQINAGDYNFDGFVNVADLVPLAAHYGQTYDRLGAGADLLSAYWIDGNADGQLGLADLTAIAANYYAYIHGYNIKKNGVLSGQVNRSQATPRPGLPGRYSFNIAGTTADAWVVAVTDGQGVEGADSAGGAGPTDLRTTLSITGLDLFSLYGVDSGPFGPGRFGLRVIEPIDIVDRFPVGKVTIAPGTTTGSVAGLVRGKRYLADLIFAPVVNLATGAPKAPAGIHGASAVDPSAIVISSVPLYLPPGDQPVDLDAVIELQPNPAGGFFVKLTATLASPGDDPTTLAIVENGYTRSYTSRLDYRNGLVSRDTDANGSFDDEAQLGDDNRDGLSASGVKQVVDDDDHSAAEREELELQGDISAYDETAGILTLTNVTSETTPGLPGVMTLHFAETTRFEERVRTDSGDIIQDLNPGALQPGDRVEATPYALTQGAGGPADSYWLHELKRVIDNRTH